MRPGSRTRQRPLTRKSKIIAAAVGALLVWPIVSISLAAQHGEDAADLAAADYASTSAAAATSAAEQHIANGDADGAAAFAREALENAPISADALRSLGLAEQNLGHGDTSAAIFSQAAALGWQDLATQLWLAQAFVRAKDYPHAAERMDAALRTNPNSVDLYKLLNGLLVDRSFAIAMMARTENNPTWRLRYFQVADDMSPDELAARAQILKDLAGTASPPTRDEVIPLLFAMVQAKQVAPARDVWFRTQHLPPQPIYDPHFQNVGTSRVAPFEWLLRPVLGAEAASPSGGSALSVMTDGSAGGTLMRQVTAFTPGVHRLNVAAKVPDKARGAFGWRVRCIATGQVALDTLGGTGGSPYSFTIAPGCDSQVVELQLSRAPAAAGSHAEFSEISVE